MARFINAMHYACVVENHCGVRLVDEELKPIKTLARKLTASYQLTEDGSPRIAQDQSREPQRIVVGR
jgi:hypothetical protein